MHRDDDASQVRDLLATKGWTQKELAEKARVSQPTISRALKRNPLRATQPHRRLMQFIHEHSLPSATAVSAVSHVWDGTPEHDSALAALITASSALWPKMGADR